MKKFISQLQAGHSKTQLIAFGILLIMAVISVGVLKLTGLVYFVDLK